MFIQKYKIMTEVQSRRLVQIYRESRKLLLPLSDPLDVEFSLHRQLSSSREEVYSDWLQWVLEQVSDVQLIGRILGSTELERRAIPQEKISVDREVCVERGHIDQSGRLDLVVRQGFRRLAVIEAKTREYEEVDLNKHVGYRRSINSSDVELIFLAINPPVSDPGGFRFLSWADVCVNLRRIVPLRLEPERILGSSLILAFVGAVEQNLLGFVSPETPSLPSTKITRLVDHLSKARTEA